MIKRLFKTALRMVNDVFELTFIEIQEEREKGLKTLKSQFVFSLRIFFLPIFIVVGAFKK